MYLTAVAIASLLVMAFNVSTNSLDVNVLDLGLVSKDTNIGSIDIDTLFNCVGAAITCDNDNTVTNNVAINNETSQPNEPPTCEECFTNYLTDEEITMLEDAGFIGVDNYCAYLSELSPEKLETDLENFENTLVNIGIDADIAQAVVDCLREVLL
jgi:hypothetical protein